MREEPKKYIIPPDSLFENRKIGKALNEREYIQERLTLPGEGEPYIENMLFMVRSAYPEHVEITVKYNDRRTYIPTEKIGIYGWRKKTPDEIKAYDDEKKALKDAELLVLQTLAKKHSKTIL